MGNACVLITGGSKGIGLYLAQAFAKRNYNLYLLSLPNEDLHAVAAELEKSYAIKTWQQEIDLTTNDSTKDVLDFIATNNLDIKVLVNNAGIGHFGQFDKTDELFYKQLLNINVVTPTLLTRAVLPNMHKLPKAYILNVASMGGFFNMPFKVVYSASKAYVLNFSRSLNMELKTSNVFVCSLCPSGVDTFPHSKEHLEKVGGLVAKGRQSATQVAEFAVDQMFKGKRIIVPGRINRMLWRVSRMLPEYWVTSIFGWKLRPLYEEE